MNNDRYRSPAAVEAAIAAAAKKAYGADKSLTITERIRLEQFNRFLSRVFAERDRSDWVLKGGTGMLARVASGRSTTDIDLFRRGHTLDEALEDLRRRASVSLDDFFRFEYTGHSDTIDGNQQAYTDGYRVSFDVYIGASKKGNLHVDLVVGVVTTDEVAVERPAHVLDLPKLPSNDYRLYPIVDQIADKVCATLTVYNGRPSTREKDLVDLVILAATHDVCGDKLRRALEVEVRMRAFALPHVFEVPSTWGARYAKLAWTVPACAPFGSVDLAMGLMRGFIDPVLSGSVAGMRWDHQRLVWH